MPGEVTFHPALGDHVAANRANLRAAWRRRRTYKTWIGLTAAMAGIGALLGALMDSDVSVVSMAIAYAILGLVLIPTLHGLAYMMAPRRIRRVFNQQSSASLAQHWRWSDDGLTAENAQGQSRQIWSDLFGWRETSPTLLLYLNERQFYVLPRRAVSSDDWNDLIDTVRRSGLAVH